MEACGKPPAAGSAKHVAALSGRAEVSYLPGSGEIVFADHGARTLSWVRGASVTLAASERDGITTPVAVAVAGDSRKVFVANADPPAVIMVDIDSGAVNRIEVASAPATLRRLGGPVVFQLNEAGAGAVHLLSFASGQPRLSFIPAPVDPAGDGGAE